MPEQTKDELVELIVLFEMGCVLYIRETVGAVEVVWPIKELSTNMAIVKLVAFCKIPARRAAFEADVIV